MYRLCYRERKVRGCVVRGEEKPTIKEVKEEFETLEKEGKIATTAWIQIFTGDKWVTHKVVKGSIGGYSGKFTKRPKRHYRIRLKRVSDLCPTEKPKEEELEVKAFIMTGKCPHCGNYFGLYKGDS